MIKRRNKRNNINISKNHYCISLNDATKEHKRIIGNKGSNIWLLKKLGFSVPPCFFITTTAFEHHVKRKNINFSLLNEKEEFRFSPELKEEIKINFELLLNNNKITSFAVRSSSKAEDLDRHSFAGLYETKLNISGLNEINNAIKSVWKSFWNDEAVNYRLSISSTIENDSMGVIVQSMVDCAWGGVLFSKYPNNKSNDIMIEYVKGHPNKIVSGDVKADRLIIDRANYNIHDTNDGMKKELIFELLNCVELIENYFCKPVDIEWCIDKNSRLWLLQVRPISLKRRKNKRLTVKEIQIYEEPFSTLGCDLAIKSHYRWLKAMMKLHHRKYPISIVEDNGFLINKAPFPRESSNKLFKIWESIWRIITYFKGSKVYNNYKNKIIPEHYKDLNKLSSIDLSLLEPCVLRKGFNKSVELYLELQENSFPIGTLAVVSSSLLNRMCNYWSRNNFLFDSQNILSGLKNRTIEGVQEQYVFINNHKEEDLIQIVNDIENDKISYLEDSDHFFLNNYLYLWADRYPRDPAWKINCEAVLNSVEHYKEQKSNKIKGLNPDKSKEEIKELFLLFDSLLFGWLHKIIFNYIYFRAKLYYPEKENRNYNVYKTIMVIRTYVRAIGRYAISKKLLSSMEDIFYLKLQEINDLLIGKIDAQTLDESISNRKSRNLNHEWYYKPKIKDLKIRDDYSNVIFHGEPLSPGVAIGKACVINSFSDLSKVKSGDIIICNKPRPAWSAAFARSGGAIILSGSLLSHGSILVRELGIPAIINTIDFEEHIVDGTNIRLNGSIGEICLI